MRGIPWIAAFALCGLGLARVPAAPVHRHPSGPAVTNERPHEETVPPVPLDSAWRAAPFRPDRTLPAERYSAVESLAAEEASSRERPAWVLRGVVSGSEPFALFEGVDGSGSPTTLLSVGDEVESYVVTAIRGDTVVVANGALQWTYTVEVPWR